MNSLAPLLQKTPRQSRGIILICAYGLAAGVAAVAFQVAINVFFGFTIQKLSHGTELGFILGSLAVILSTSLAVGYLLNSFSPQASGSGVPQLKVAF